jgi:hypothetical protein
MTSLEKIEDRYFRRSWSGIVTQRYQCLGLRCGTTKGDEDVIVVQRRATMTQSELEAALGRVENRPDEVTDDAFRLRCKAAKVKCYRYAMTFRSLEILEDLLDYSSNLSGVVIALTKLSVKNAVIICFVLIFVIVLASLGDWKRLREKYCRLGHKYKLLANSTEPKRLERFESLAISFDSNSLFIDTTSEDD